MKTKPHFCDEKPNMVNIFIDHHGQWVMNQLTQQNVQGIIFTVGVILEIQYCPFCGQKLEAD